MTLISFFKKSCRIFYLSYFSGDSNKLCLRSCSCFWNLLNINHNYSSLSTEKLTCLNKTLDEIQRIKYHSFQMTEFANRKFVRKRLFYFIPKKRKCCYKRNLKYESDEGKTCSYYNIVQENTVCFLIFNYSSSFSFCVTKFKL